MALPCIVSPPESPGSATVKIDWPEIDATDLIP